MIRASTHYGIEQQTMAAATMIRYGGSFAASIGEAFMVADSANRSTLTTAFADLFQRYANWPN